jgi:hypothetical protein
VFSILVDLVSHGHSFVLEPLRVLEFSVFGPISCLVIFWCARNPRSVLCFGGCEKLALHVGLLMGSNWWWASFSSTGPFVFLFKLFRVVEWNVSNFECAECLIDNIFSIWKLYMWVSFYSRSGYFLPRSCRSRWKTWFLEVWLGSLVHL